MAEVDQGPEHTVMSANVWAKYLQMARETDLEISDYEAYQRMSRRERKSMLKCIMVDGRMMKTHGPFNCWVRLDSTSIKLPVYVTADVRMGRLITSHNPPFRCGQFWPHPRTGIRGREETMANRR